MRFAGVYGFRRGGETGAILEGVVERPRPSSRTFRRKSCAVMAGPETRTVIRRAMNDPAGLWDRLLHRTEIAGIAELQMLTTLYYLGIVVLCGLLVVGIAWRRFLRTSYNREAWEQWR